MKKTVIIFSMTLIMALTASCKCQKGVSTENLTSTPWELSTIKGVGAAKVNYPNGLPSAIFTTDGKINGHGGCNRYGGSYTLDANGKLTLGQMISTKMFCEGVAEDVYMKAISTADGAKIKGNNLVLLHGDEEVMTFVPKKAE